MRLTQLRSRGRLTLALVIVLLAGVSPSRAGLNEELAVTPMTLASGLNYPWGLVIDATSVYWADQLAGAGNSNQSIRKVGKNGGPITNLASGVDCPFSMAIDATSVYWLECHSGDLKKVGINGGAVTTLVSGQSFPQGSGIVVDGTHVYFVGDPQSAGYVLKKVGINGGPATALTSAWSYPVIIAVDGTHVYFADYDAGSLNKVGKNGGPVTTLVSGESFPQGTDGAIDSTNLYWISGNGNTIKKVGINGGPVTTLATSAGDYYHGSIAVDATNVYVAGSGVYMVGKNGGPVTTLVAGLFCPGGLAVDATDVYWSDNSCSGADGYTGYIKKLPISSETVCDIQLNKTSFVNGDQVIAQVARLANPGPNAVPVEVKLWFELPGSPLPPPVPFLTVGADGSFVLAPGFDQDFGPLPLATVQAAFPRGPYHFNCRLLHAVTGALLGEDFNPFDIR